LETRKLRPLYIKEPSASLIAYQDFPARQKHLKRPFKENKPKIQLTAFRNEIASVSHKEQNAKISRQSSLLKLDPFIDEETLIKVGGRLENSILPFEV